MAINSNLPDKLNEIGVLKRREIEARILAPVVEALVHEFGEAHVLDVVRDTIQNIARHQGSELAKDMGGCSLVKYIESMEAWKADDALQMEVIEQGATVFAYNTTRCKYAEMYKDLGIPELGMVLSCNRDQALIEGFNPNIKLKRTQTIMEGAAFCDFRFELKKEAID
jgi:predicted ArsR family transcriptional regulator